MPSVIVSNYFYGDESTQLSYFCIPRLLISHARFKHICVEAKLLYGLMLDRMGLSSEHGRYDADGRVFIYYSLLILIHLDKTQNFAHEVRLDMADSVVQTRITFPRYVQNTHGGGYHESARN